MSGGTKKSDSDDKKDSDDESDDDDDSDLAFFFCEGKEMENK